MATQYSNKPIVTDGLVYALDFGNPKSYVSGSATAQSLIYRPTPARFETLLPGDYGTPAAAYSVRKVVSSYTGSAMMVQSASVSQSIGFDSNGNLDTAALASFAGSGNAFVKIWYDQSGNGRDASQAVTANQPQIVSSGNVITEGGKPTIDHTRTQTLNISTNLNIGKIYSIFGIVKFDIQGAEIIGSSSPGYSYAIYADATNTYHSANSAFGSSNGVFGLNFALLSIHRDNSTTVSQYKNSTILGSTFTLFDNRDFYFRSLSGEQNNSYNLDGKLSEAIIYPSNQSSNRTKIEDNINTYYQIFTSSYNPTPDSDNNFLDFNGNNTPLNTQQSFPGFSYDQGNSTVMYVGETKGNSTTFTQDGTLSIVSTTSSVGFGSPSNTFGRSYPVTGLKHVTLRFSSGSVDCFVNGIPVSASAIFPTGSSIAGGQLNIPLYTGSLGGFQIYNRPLTSDEIWNNYQLTAPRYALGPVQNKPYNLDENAYLFLQSAGITDPIITGSIDTFVRGLKSASLWDKMIAIYPFVGTGSTGINLTGSHRWNLKEPSLVTYPLTFTGSWVGSTSGSAPSGSGTNITMGGVAPTTFYPFYNTQSAHISILSYDTPTSSSYLMGTGMTEDLAISTLAGDYGTPAAAYSVRKVRTAYSGALMDVRRSLDNVTSSIGYVSNGDLDTGSLLTFVRTEGNSYLPGAYSGLAAAYSLRRVSGSYTGSAIDVRRDSDNYIFPVGFTSSGDLDTQTLLQTLNTGSNIIPYSNDFTQARWNLTNTQITSSVILGPFGRGSGSFLNETSTNDIHRIFESFITPTSSIHSISVFVKKQHRRYIALGSTPNMGNNSSVLFDLDTTSSLFTVNNGTGFQTITSSIHSVDDGWFRLSYVFRQGRNDVYPILYLVNSPSVYTNIPPGYVGQPGTGSYIYGFQYTTGSILQPYIETTGSARYNQPITNPMGYVTQWYDQSGNGRHVTQTATGSQPLIVSSGSLITENGKPALSFDGTNDYLDASSITTNNPKSIFVFAKNQYIGGAERVLFDSISTNQATFYKDGSGVVNLAFGVNAGTSFTLNTSSNIYSILHDGASSNVYLNSSTQILNNSNLGTNSFNGLRIGAGRNTPNVLWTGTISEFILYSGSQASNRPLIENNINNYYNIYTGSNQGFVARWYDQSGNNRHASQTATGSQPLIVLSGSVISSGTKPSIYWKTNGFDNLIFTQINNIQTVFHTSQLVETGSDQSYLLGDTGIFEYAAGANSPQTWLNSQYTLAQIRDGFNFINGTSYNLTTKNRDLNRNLITLIHTAAVGTANQISIDRGNPRSWRGYIQEITLYTSSQASNREPIEYNINNYYNIYPQTSSFATSSFTIKADSGSISGSLNNRLTSGIAASGPLGLITVSRTGSNSLTIARNGVTSSFAVPASGALSTGLYLGAINNNGIAVGNSPVNISFASVGTGLTGADALNLNRLVYSLQYNLGRPDPDYTAILNYATIQGYTLPTLAVQLHQNRLINDLKAAGIWGKLDSFVVFATNGNSNFALIDWKRLSQYTAVNSPSFTPNQGFAGNGSTSYINTNYNPSVDGINFSQNNASMGIWRRILGAGISGGSGEMGALQSSPAVVTRMTVSRGFNLSGFNDAGPGGIPVTNIASTGLISMNRVNSTTYNFFNNGVLYEQRTQVTTGLPNLNLYIFGHNYDNTFIQPNQSQFSMVYMGADLTNEQVDFTNALNRYLTAISS